MNPTLNRTLEPEADPKEWWRRVCWVDQRLATSGDLPADPLEALTQLRHWEEEGVTHVFDMRGEADDSDFIHANSSILSYWFGIDDNGTKRPDTWFAQVTDRAREILSDPASRLLVHCHMGINRGPSSLYAIMLAQGWAPTEALSAIRAARPIAGLIYAADATSWWSRINLQPAQQVEEHQRAVREWFEMNNINVATVIRRIRQ
jgi:hypothetical protein